MPYVNILIGLAVLVWLIVRQLTPQTLKESSRLSLILIIIGAVQTVTYVNANGFQVFDLVLLTASAVIGSGLAVLRAMTVRIWRGPTDVQRQGNWLTAVLWVVGIGQHLLIDTFISAHGLGQASMLIYFGIVLLVQRAWLMNRARREGLFSANPAFR